MDILFTPNPLQEKALTRSCDENNVATGGSMTVEEFAIIAINAKADTFVSMWKQRDHEGISSKILKNFDKLKQEDLDAIDAIVNKPDVVVDPVVVDPVIEEPIP